MKRANLIRDVLQAARDFNDRQLWERFSNFDCFAVKVPGQAESMLGVVLGNAGGGRGRRRRGRHPSHAARRAIPQCVS
jgi:hypothetical protein